MPIFDGSSKNRDTGIYYEPVTLENLDLYEQQNGRERAEGYRDCMFDLLKKIHHILETPDGSEDHTLFYVRVHLRKLFEEEKTIYKTLDRNLQSTDNATHQPDDITKLTL